MDNKLKIEDVKENSKLKIEYGSFISNVKCLKNSPEHKKMLLLVPSSMFIGRSDLSSEIEIIFNYDDQAFKDFEFLNN